MKPEDQLLLLSARLHFDEDSAKRFDNILSGTQSSEVPMSHQPRAISQEHERRAMSHSHQPSAMSHEPILPPDNCTLLHPSSSLDWQYILKNAQRLGIAPLLYKHLSRPDWRVKVPNHAHQTLKSAYRKSAFRSLRIQAQIQQLNQAAADREIPIIFLKGAALSGWIYEDIALRPMSDIDVLTKDEDIPKMKQMLLDLGYFQTQDAYQTRILEDFAVEWNHLPGFYLENGLKVEVHTNVFGKHANGSSIKHLLWETSTNIKRDDTAFHFLSNECFLLHLCLHLYNHMLKGALNLYWICDILEFIRKTDNELNWDGLWSHAGALGARNEVAQVFATLNAYHLLPIPSITREASQKKTLPLDSLMSFEKARKVGQHGLLSANMGFLKRLYSEEGSFRTTCSVFKILLPSKEHMIVRYPEASSNWFRCYSAHICERTTRFFRSALLNIKS